MIKFDMKVSMNALNSYSSYRKVYGLITAHLYGLPVVTSGFVVNHQLTDIEITDIENEYGSFIMCRADTPKKMWSSLPRGRDIHPSKINDFYNKVIAINKSAILLCFRHPSVFFTGNFIKRYNISGGINILIEWFSKIVFEYVGAGFDVGDISRGAVNSHTIITIPWEFGNQDPKAIFSQCNHTIISESQYTETRNSRINTLVNQMGYEWNEVQNIPLTFKGMEIETFDNIYKNCVKPVINNEKYFNTEIPLTIQINMYGNQPHIFEIWESNS